MTAWGAHEDDVCTTGGGATARDAHEHDVWNDIDLLLCLKQN